MSLVLAANAGTRARFEESGQVRSPLVVHAALRASAFWGGDAHLAYLSSLHIGWSGLASADPTAPIQDLDHLRRAVSADQNNPVYALELARAIKFYGASAPQVDAAFNEAFDRYPAYPLAHADYATYLAETGRLEEARENLAIARLSDEDAPEFVAAIGRAEDAITQATSGL
jgi:hypothetical protein